MLAFCGIVLLGVGLLGGVYGGEGGCARWRTEKNGQVCCEACKPGNRIVKECGPHPKDLCTPCEVETYTVDLKASICSRCTQCIDVQRVEKACTITSDTQCGCIEGYRCGDQQCSFCQQECTKGQQPLPNRTCQACPPGTFSDKIHSKCVPWSTKCPRPAQRIVANGTAVSDIICSPTSKCGEGRRCGDEQCSFCEQECTKGQQPLPNRTCQACPPGTFSDKIHSKCVPWSTKCPEPDQQIVAKGTAVSDIICGPKGGNEWMVAAIACIVLCVVIAAAFCAIIRQTMRKKIKMAVEAATPEKLITEVPRRVVQQEECSFCFPQQEQGSSLESVASLDSKEKLLGAV